MPQRKKSSQTRHLASRVLHHVMHVLSEQDGYVDKSEVERRIVADLEFSDWEMDASGKSARPRWKNALWHTTDAVKSGFMTKSRGRWRITPEGRKALDAGPDALFEAAEAGYRVWAAGREDSGATSRERSRRAEQNRAKAHIFRDGLRLLERAPGRTLEFDALLNRLPALLPEDLREQLESASSDQFDFSYRVFGRAARSNWIERGGGRWTLTDRGVSALGEWQDPVELWRKAREVGGAVEVRERIPYLGSVADFANVPQALYRSQSATIGQLVGDIERGTMALPDIQRPFVWKNTKVRDLLDSLFRGFPFGFLLTWKNPVEVTTRRIGESDGGKVLPHALVIDGQQRLTSLYAVLTGEHVFDESFRRRRIRIGFHPLQGTFAVADATLKRNPEWLADVSAVFTDQMGALSVLRGYMERLREAREITPEHERAAEGNIQRLVNLRNLTVNVLEIGVEAAEEQVAEIFVRINSKGQNLRQADFILTLLAVFWEEGRERLEDFSRSCLVPDPDGKPSPFNRVLFPGPDDLVRVNVAVGHRRARLSAAYEILRGKDPKSGVVTEEARAANLEGLAKAQEQVLGVNNWHEFLKTLSAAGYRHRRLIQSTVTSLYAYSLFLIGRGGLQVPLDQLRRVIGRWYTMSVITGRYVGGSSESAMEEDLGRLRGVVDADTFVERLENAMTSELTNDFWEVTLPSRLESSNVRTLSPFFAAQAVLGAKALYSSLTIGELLDPLRASTKEDLEVHHLFPKGWLKRNGVDSPRDYNQVANLALLEWSANIDVSDEAPGDYAPRLLARVPQGEVSVMHRLHALPAEWWKMSYPDFLRARRVELAAIIRRAFDRIGGE